jgi:hypothetical protein
MGYLIHNIAYGCVALAQRLEANSIVDGLKAASAVFE